MRTSLLVTWGVRLILAYSLGCVIIRICRWTKGGLILVQVSSSLSKKVPKTKFLRLSHLYLLTCPTFFYILSILSRVLTKNDQVLCWNWGWRLNRVQFSIDLFSWFKKKYFWLGKNPFIFDTTVPLTSEKTHCASKRKKENH